MSRPRLTRNLAVLVAVVAAGCGAGHHDRRAEPCLAKDLRPDADARKFGAFQPEGGAAVGGVVLTNRGVANACCAVARRSNSGRHTVNVNDSSRGRSRRPHRVFARYSCDLASRRSSVSPGRTGVAKRFRRSSGFGCGVTARSIFGIQARRNAWLRNGRRLSAWSPSHTYRRPELGVRARLPAAEERGT